MAKPVEQLESVVIRFAGNSGDGMQLTGGPFTSVTALSGNDLATYPNFPAEVRAPAGLAARRFGPPALPRRPRHPHVAHQLFGGRSVPGRSRTSSDSGASRSPTRALRGRLRALGLRLEVTTNDQGHLLATVHPRHAVAESQGWRAMVDLPLRLVDQADTLLMRVPIADADLPAVFSAPGDPGCRPTYVHYGGRAKRRVA